MSTQSMKTSFEQRKVQTSIKDELLVKERTEEIIQAALKVFSEKGYHKGTIKDICSASGLGPGTVYNYIRKKEDILYLVYDKMLNILIESLSETIENNKDPLDQLEEFLRKTIEIVWNNMDVMLLMYQETGALDKESLYKVLSKQSGHVELVEKILNAGRRKGIIRNKNVQLAADIIIYLMAFIPLRRWNLKRRFNEEKIKSGLVDFILQGLSINKCQ
jgi:AcrR family transcriptional regulator